MKIIRSTFPLYLSYICCLSLIKTEPHFCVRCTVESNRCQRLLYSMIRTNPQRKLALCPEIRNGRWGGWEAIEECRGLKSVRDYKDLHCGHGHQRQKRKCIRELGGNPCEDEDWETFREFQKISEDFELRSNICFSGECPGE